MLEDQETFARVLDRLRLARGLTPAALARALDVHEGDVSRWRRGKGISIKNVRKIAELFGVEREWLEALAGYPVGTTPTPEPGDAEDHAIRETTAEMREILRGVPRVYWGTIVKAFSRGVEGARDMAGLLSETPTAEESVRNPPVPPVRKPRKRTNERPDNTDTNLAASKHRSYALLGAR